jgi:hypothetical protein
MPSNTTAPTPAGPSSTTPLEELAELIDAWIAARRPQERQERQGGTHAPAHPLYECQRAQERP